MNHRIVQSYSSAEENEFQVFNAENVCIGYYVINNQFGDIEVYSAPDADFPEDYNCVDYADSADEAVEMIIQNFGE